VTQLRGDLSSGMLSPDEKAGHARALEQLTTLRESNAHLRVQNKELVGEASRRHKEAEEALKLVQPLKDQIT
jgi:hypothetical protein